MSQYLNYTLWVEVTGKLPSSTRGDIDGLTFRFQPGEIRESIQTLTSVTFYGHDASDDKEIYKKAHKLAKSLIDGKVYGIAHEVQLDNAKGYVHEIRVTGWTKVKKKSYAWANAQIDAMTKNK